MKRAAWPKSRATGGTSSRSRPTATTQAPAATKAFTAERPIPSVPPITTIRLRSRAGVLRVVAIVEMLGKQRGGVNTIQGVPKKWRDGLGRGRKGEDFQ